MPGGNFSGIGPVEPSPVFPHTSDPPVPSGLVVFRVPSVQVAVRTVRPF